MKLIYFLFAAIFAFNIPEEIREAKTHANAILRYDENHAKLFHWRLNWKFIFNEYNLFSRERRGKCNIIKKIEKIVGAIKTVAGKIFA